MASWPAGHRWEDYHVSILDKDRVHLGDLETCHRLAGNRRQYGQFGCQLTLSLHKDDPWASVLLERELHYIQVLRDGLAIFEGYHIKLDRDDVVDTGEQWIEFEFTPLAFKLGWRHGLAMNPGAAFTVNDLVDDAFKWLILRTHGALAPNTPTTGLSRVEAGWTNAADKSEGPGPFILTATGANMYEYLQRWGATYLVDFDVYFNAAWQTVFETWYPRRGVNRVEGTGDGVQIIFSDDQGQFPRQSYGNDTSQLKTVAYNRVMTADICPSPTRRTNWGHREVSIDSMDVAELPVGLLQHAYQEWCRVDDFVESEDRQWGLHWNVGDTITWKSNRLGYGPHNDIICEVAFEILDGGEEKLSVTFGKPEPDILDNLRDGGQASPYYDAPIIPYEAAPAFTFGAAHVGGLSGHFVYSDSQIALGITAPDANTVYPLVAGPNRWLFTSLANTVAITGAVLGTVNFEVAAGALPYAVPSIGFAAAAAAGAANTVIRSDATIKLVFAGDGGTAVPTVFGGNTLTIAGGTALTSAAAASTVTLNLDNTAVVPALYGDATHVAQVTIDQQGRITLAASVLITGVAPSAHNILSASHGDTVASAMTRGDIIVGTAAGWDDLAIGAANTHLESDGTDAAWVLPDIYGTPGTCTVASLNAAGATHTHAVTSSSNPGAAASLLATDANGYLVLVRLGIGRAPTALLDVYAVTGNVAGFFTTGDGSIVSLAMTNSANAWYIQNTATGLFQIRDNTGGTNPFVVVATAPTGAFRINAAEVVVNESSDNALVFRVEGASDINLVCTDPANNRVGIGTAAPDTLFDVNGVSRALNFVSDVALGTQPYACTSATVNSNLNADYTDGFHAQTATALNTIVVRDGNQYCYAARWYGTSFYDTGGTYYCTPAGATSLNIGGNIAMQALATVDGVDLSVFYAAYLAHVHTISGNTANRTPTFSGTSADYTPDLNAQCVDAATPVGGGTNLKFWSYHDGADPSTAAWHSAWAKSGTHGHDAGTYAVGAHNHPVGTLVNSTPA